MSGFLNDILYVNPQSFATNGLGENTNVPISSSTLLVTLGADLDSISGFIPQQTPDGGRLWVMNVDNTKTLLLINSVNTTSGYRIVLPPGYTTVTLEPGDSAMLVFTQGLGWRPFTVGSLT